jgi:hypothetical protein
MTSDDAVPGPRSPEGNTDDAASGADAAAPDPATGSPAAGGGEAPTPFYDHLMSMIEATALDNVRAQDLADAAFVADQKPGMSPLLPRIAGLMVAAAVGGAALAPDVSQLPPAAVADAGKPAEASAPLVAGNPVPQEPEPVAGPAPAADTRGDGPVEVAGARTAESGIPADAEAAGPSPEPSVEVVQAPAPAMPEEPALETGAVGPVSEPAVAAAAEPAPPSPIVTGSIGGADGPDKSGGPSATRTAWVVQDVNMRAGPANREPVLARIPRGRPVEMLGTKSRGWCEVVYAGQRGWIYQRFLGATPAPGGR